MGANEVMRITVDNFDKDVLQGVKASLVEVWAPWCGSCHTLSPVIESIAADYAQFLSVYRLNADVESDLVNRYQITTVPTLLLFRNGKLLDRRSGNRSRKELDEWLKSCLNI